MDTNAAVREDATTDQQCRKIWLEHLASRDTNTSRCCPAISRNRTRPSSFT